MAGEGPTMPAAGGVATRLLEREAESGRIERAISRAAAGRGALIVVEGPAGIGKTALVAHARATAAASGVQVLHARGAALERGFAFGVVRQLFEPVLVTAGADEREELLQGPAGLA